MNDQIKRLQKQNDLLTKWIFFLIGLGVGLPLGVLIVYIMSLTV